MTAAPVPASLLVTTWPETLVAPEELQKGRSKVALPGRDGEVPVKPVTVTALAAAFLWLRETGAAQLSLTQKKGLLGGSKTSVSVQPLGAGAPAAEGALLAAVARTKDGNVRDVVFHWLGKDSHTPFQAAHRAIQTAGAELGLFAVVEAADRGRIGKLLKGAHELQANVPALLATEGAARSWAEHVRGIAAREPELWDALKAAVTKGVENRTESD